MSANPPKKKNERTSVINEKKPSTTTPPGPPQLCAKTSTGAHQRRISPNSAHFFQKFGAPDLPPGIIGTMGRIGLVKVAVNFKKSREYAVHTSWEVKRQWCWCRFVVDILFWCDVISLFVVCVFDFWCDVGCVLVLWVY